MAQFVPCNANISSGFGSQHKRWQRVAKIPIPSPAILLKPLRMQPGRVSCPTQTTPAPRANVTTTSSGLQDESKDYSAIHSHNISMEAEPDNCLRDHQPAWAVFKQCMLLGAAACCAAPLILVLDIAERACFALCQMQQIRQVMGASRSNAQAKQQQQHQISLCSSLPAAARVSENHSGPSSRRVGGNNSRQRPSDLWLLDLWPPFGFMALAVLPPVLLATRHLYVGTPGVMQPLLSCVASLILQAYANLYLAVLQRAKPQPVAATTTPTQQTAAEAAEASDSNSTDSRREQAHWWRAAAVGAQQPLPESPARGLHNVKATGIGVQQSQQSNAHARFKNIGNTSKAVTNFFGLTQVCGDVFRFWCISSAVRAMWQQQAAAALGWAHPISVLHHDAADGGVPEILAAAAAAAVGLQQNLGATVWLATDCVLSASSAAVYVLAAAARLLPVLDKLLQS